MAYALPAIAEVNIFALDEVVDQYTTLCTLKTSHWKEYCFESFLKYTLVTDHAHSLSMIRDTQRIHVMCLVPATGADAEELIEKEKGQLYSWVVNPTVRTWVVEAMSGLLIQCI